jgi:hypothetical protein
MKLKRPSRLGMAFKNKLLKVYFVIIKRDVLID